MDKLKEQVKWLKIYSIFNTLVLVVVLLLMFSNNKNMNNSVFPKTDTLEVSFIKAERMDIVEENGKLGISLSNSTTSPNPTFDDVEIEGVSSRNIPNIIFFDGEGDEVGGMAFSNSLDSEWQKGIRHLAFDGFKQDEVVTMSHFIKNDSVSRTGLYINQRPNIHILDAFREIGLLPTDSEDMLRKKVIRFKENNPERYEEIWQLKPRISVHKEELGDAEINIHDGEGRVRIKIFVKDNGESGIHFFDAEGDVLKEILN